MFLAEHRYQSSGRDAHQGTFTLPEELPGQTTPRPGPCLSAVLLLRRARTVSGGRRAELALLCSAPRVGAAQIPEQRWDRACSRLGELGTRKRCVPCSWLRLPVCQPRLQKRFRPERGVNTRPGHWGRPCFRNRGPKAAWPCVFPGPGTAAASQTASRPQGRGVSFVFGVNFGAPSNISLALGELCAPG